MGAVGRNAKGGCCCPRITRSAAKVTNRIVSPRISRKYHRGYVANVKRFTLRTTPPGAEYESLGGAGSGTGSLKLPSWDTSVLDGTRFKRPLPVRIRAGGF